MLTGSTPSTLMSLLGHVVLTLLFDGFNMVARRVHQRREGSIQLEEGLNPMEGQAEGEDIDSGESGQQRVIERWCAEELPVEPAEKAVVL